jgi:hypothetical protein
VLLGPEKSVAATVAVRDPSTDLAILTLADEAKLPLPALADASGLKLAKVVLALGRSWRGNLVASAEIIGELGGRNMRIVVCEGFDTPPSCGV